MAKNKMFRNVRVVLCNFGDLIMNIKVRFLCMLVVGGCSFFTMESRQTKKVNNKKLIVITGVTRGLGRAMADQFIQRGWVVAGCARSKNLIEKMKRTYGKEHDFQVVDVADDKAVSKWAKKVSKRYGAPDILINNAAIINKERPLWTIPAKEFNAVLTINVIGTANVIRAFAPSMVKAKQGLIINISSSSGRESDEGFAPYSTAKFAIEGLTKTLSKELPQGMTVVALDPGAVGTDMFRECYPAAVATVSSPEHWAVKAVPYILSIKPEDNGKSLTVAT